MRRLDLRKTQAARLNTIRDINRQIVLNYVREREPISRAEIARETDLQRSTISAIVEALTAEGLVEEVGEGESTGGRRPTLLKLRTKEAIAVGVAITPSCTTIASSDLAGRIVEQEEFPTDADPSKTLNQVVSVIKQLSARNKGSIEAVGVSLPGLVDPSTGNAVYVPYFKWRDIPVAKSISTAVGLPVIIDNDANAVALAELWFGRPEVSDARDFILVLVAEGVGTGIIFDGQVYRGQRGAAGEFGHMVIGTRAPVPCSCGKSNCWEAFSSEGAAVARYLALSGEAPVANLGFRELVDRSLAGESHAEAALIETAHTDNGVAGIWTDMNEPSDFIDQTGKNQLDVVSYDEGEKSTHAKNRNVFALLMARATYEGLARLRPELRPYVIRRAGYAGIQRYSTMWTGDTNSTWEALQLNVPMFTTLGMSGEPFVGSDVGGFIGRGSGELLVRAYQVSFLAPFCRNHKVIDGYDNEPWRYGDHYEGIIRRYLKLRYRLLPFLYTELEAAHRTGVPLFRPLVLNYQDDNNTYNLDDQFMIGNDILVAPVVKPDVTQRLVYLPKGVWYDYWTNKRYEGGTMFTISAPLETVPMFVRGGAIIPTGPELNFVGEKPNDPITFNIYPDDNGSASVTLYEDDGLSPAYKLDGYRRTIVTVSRMLGGHTVNIGTPQGRYNPGPRKLNFLIKSPGPMRNPTTVLDNGTAQTVRIR